MLAGTVTASPLCRSHVWLLKTDRKVKITAVYCIKAATSVRSDATRKLLKATLSLERDSLADCCPRTRLDTEFKEKSSVEAR